MNYETIEVDEKDGILIIRLRQKSIFLRAAEKFREEFIPLVERDATTIVLVALDKVSVMNSSGLGILILARDVLERKSGRMAVCGLQTLMEEIFLRMRLDLLFEIYKNEEEALARLSEGKKATEG